MLARIAVVALIVLCTVVARAAVSGGNAGERWALVADAGSTGTRVYLFRLSGATGKVEVTDVGKGPALSSFRGMPERAAEAVAKQVEKAKTLIPPVVQSSVPLSVLATAGMRLVAEADQEAIYAGLRSGLLGAGGGVAATAYPFDSSALEARTISGREEGVFALIAANYLAKRLHTTLRAASDGLMGVLDLGGSSTQVGVPPVLASGDRLQPRLGAEHTFVRSFLNLGMERMRQRTYRRFVDAASATQLERRAVPNPCAFFGYVEGGEAAWRGTGEAAACEAAVRSALAEERSACAAATKAPATECLSAAPVPLPAGPEGAAKFFLISGYLYVTDFASWTLKHGSGSKPSGLETGVPAMPTIRELRAAADVVCSEPWDTLGPVALDPERKHSFTPAKKVPHRCFEINYVVALLSLGYGFAEDARLFHIVDEIDGLEIEWTLGAFLHSASAAMASGGGDEPQEEL